MRPIYSGLRGFVASWSIRSATGLFCRSRPTCD